MTSEVVLMNRRAVALAADSATTVSHWDKGRQVQRYFKGTNKLFHISAKEPVGLMINGAGTLQGVPWDVLVKTFREELGTETFPSLTGYVPRLFDWLEKNSKAFPPDFLEEQFVADAVEAAGRIALAGIQAANAITDSAARDAAFTAGIETRIKAVEAAPFLGNATPKDSDNALDTMKDRVEEGFRNDAFLSVVTGRFDFDKLVEASILAVFKDGHSTLDNTGIIVAGFGADEYFPSTDAYDVYGNVLGKLIYARIDRDCRKISQRNVSELIPLAKAEMIKTFIYGTSVGGLTRLGEFNQRGLDDFEGALRARGAIDASVNSDAEKAAAHDAFNKSSTEYFWINHTSPLKQVVGVLPFRELADLSETLVTIESLKERVTTNEESVSGPIDVAMITKNDGFIWIKRKHYFEPEFNPRYFAGLTSKGETDEQKPKRPRGRGKS